jgi:NTP pyrophosphatase (non-canonical NTP hydrolase)
MTPEDYVIAASRTEPPDGPILHRLANERTVRLLHAAFGLCTETGEIQDTIKKHIFYGKPVDTANLEEEFGDVLWYLALLCRYLNVSFEQMMAKNIAKLKARFPEKFTEELALNRDLKAEQTAVASHIECACWSTGEFVWVKDCEYHPWLL